MGIEPHIAQLTSWNASSVVRLIFVVIAKDIPSPAFIVGALYVRLFENETRGTSGLSNVRSIVSSQARHFCAHSLLM